jgi:hypothetical protein
MVNADKNTENYRNEDVKEQQSLLTPGEAVVSFQVV